jgi:hypothetical protein
MLILCCLKQKNKRTKNISQGIVLFVMLIFLKIFSLISLYQLSRIASLIQFNTAYLAHLQNEILAKKSLDEAENYLLQQMPACLLKAPVNEEWRRLPYQWWQQHGCHGENNRRSYYFIVEALGEDTCALIREDHSFFPMIAYYYRLTLYFPEAGQQKIILQSTVAKSRMSTLPCEASPHYFVVGQQTKREI